MSSIRPPEDWKKRGPDTLDILLFVREQLQQGVMPEMFFGRVDVHALLGFVDGTHFTLYCQHQQDQRYMDFITWLRDVKHEFPAGGGWAKKFLEDCHGDHREALDRFFDRMAEFAALRGGPR
ncbi:hypothetical protein [Hyalangium versicolor]|uniref:hypothetical protein n=1 Tax=Hyalangium versicolor TaxID=2861190 RepID=UPI001CCDF0B2|nr:hypothetical protein [Hyalangium versicolor]